MTEAKKKKKGSRGTILAIALSTFFFISVSGYVYARTHVCFCASARATTGIFVHNTMRTAFEAYRHTEGNYPSTREGIEALIAPPGGRADQWRGPYLTVDKVPHDPWGQPYRYAFPGVHNKDGYDLWSDGPDKKTGTADDIGNW